MALAPDPWAFCADQIDPPPNPHVDDPAGWVKVRLDEHLWSKQVEIAQAVQQYRKVAVKACHGPGKGLPLDTWLPTPAGWTTMAEVEPGDLLLDEAGRPCTVVAVSPIWSRPCYKVAFSDGAEVTTDDGHQWSTLRLDERHSLRERTRNARRPAPLDWRDYWSLARTMTTPEIAETLRTPSGQLRHGVPLSQPLDLPAVTLPVSPYVLGAWLGDGTSCRAEITCHEDDRAILDRCAALGENVRRRQTAKYAWSLSGPLNDRPLLSLRLKAIGVLNNKHIPSTYLRASRAQRIELLRGIMDTDGFSCDGSVGIDLTSERLAGDVAELVRSLGCSVKLRPGPATCNGVPAGVRYRAQWRSPFQPFHLARKAANWSAPKAQASRFTMRTITSIESVPTLPTRCIEVSSPSRLYLATKHMIPTHNSYLAGRIVCWWIDVHPMGEAFAVTTAPTDPQVKAILWREITRAHRKGQLTGRVTLDAQWKTGAGELVAYGRKPADHDENGFQGIHDFFVLVVLDEACGVPKTLWTATDTLVTNEDARILAIGNPDDPNSEFARICEGAPEDGTSGMSKEGWWVITISLFDTPNFTGEWVPDRLRKVLPSRVWLEERRVSWGEGSPLWTSKVLGRFPTDSKDGVIPWSWLKRCQGVDATSRTGELRVPMELGVDIGASETGDETVIVARGGGRVMPIPSAEHGPFRRLRTGDSEEIVDGIIAVVLELRVTSVKVDAIGVGFGVVGSLRRRLASEVRWPVEVHGINVSEAAQEPTRFVNKRAEIWWEVGREYSRTGAWDLTDVDDQTLNELQSPRYFERNGRIVIEEKSEIRKRLGRSPDNADAVLLAFVVPPRVEPELDHYDDRRLTGRR